MGQVIAVISGKGGTGKTTLSAGLAACLAAEGCRVLAVDLDVGLRNLDISWGLPRARRSLLMSCSPGLTAWSRWRPIRRSRTSTC
ncbi:MAG: AAA family ATPase [Oscillospiraceae bacterium]